jgi:uncharacterized protein (DUF1786 family)
MFRHLQTAVGEVQAALEAAEALADDAERVNQLKTALHELRRSLSRAGGELVLNCNTTFMY